MVQCLRFLQLQAAVEVESQRACLVEYDRVLCLFKFLLSFLSFLEVISAQTALDI